MRRRTGAAVVAIGLLVCWSALRAGAQSRAGTGLDLMDVDLMFIGAHPDVELRFGLSAHDRGEVLYLYHHCGYSHVLQVVFSDYTDAQ
jgi:hypothetical protein